ncbi:MAG: hypothetical protein KUG83_11235 [Gammaproteobacteria bacterium]|nr:hypothetical protein [Gammaproteobacteria bacterium]
MLKKLPVRRASLYFTAMGVIAAGFGITYVNLSSTSRAPLVHSHPLVKFDSAQSSTAELQSAILSMQSSFVIQLDELHQMNQQNREEIAYLYSQLPDRASEK